MVNRHDDNRNPTIREVVSVTVTQPIRPKGRKAPRKGSRNSRVETVVTVDPRVMAAAKAILRPGERIVIVSETRVDIVRR